ncbi:molecular chaperone Tir [Trinickia symbiotica]|uniref:Molecular chaperone Tir n=1 Tax=Trinickia symbiotica TaxID=863227 RepID=A0A2T3XMN5_9BURK|nr:TIR domain-containing protein [Trinickia symbiotica]PTB17771.1 molecular chaperone Tir [Trinickia symbiotica]
MPKRNVFFSFHFDNDVMRVQQVRNMGVIEGNSPVSPNTWEEVKRKGDASIEKWIDDNMKGKSCVVVLIGSETSKRPWVKYEIQKAWKDGKGVVGIHIHNLKCPNTGTCTIGADPLAMFTFKVGDKIVTPKTYNPKSSDAYNDIADNLDKWVEEAIKIRAG